MRLGELIAGAAPLGAGTTCELVGDPSTEIVAMTMDSRAVVPGSLFACVPGQHVDGHSFAPDAVAAGSVALLCERPLGLGVAEVVVSSVRLTVGPLAASLYGHPSRALKVVGITGTNGKTTTCAFVDSVFRAAGWSSVVVGTLTQERTTPEAPELQARLARWRDEGGKAVAMEVSSHALAQHRVEGMEFAACVFTNLSSEHLDYHGDMDSYFEAKASLFQPDRVGVAIVNRDDRWGTILCERLRSCGMKVETYSMGEVSDLRLDPHQSSFRWGGIDLTVRVGGRVNVANAVAAAASARALGIGDGAIAAGLCALEGVPGRLQPVDGGQAFGVLVDYAHTPDGLASSLSSVREMTAGRVLLVFGAGGDRDRSKRATMGKVAAELADVVLVTSDNPRSEEPLAIISAILGGMDGPAEVIVEPDRATAIGMALSRARAGDTVIVAGKGHEKGQDLGDRYIDFDDVDVAREALSRLTPEAARGGP